MSVQLALGAAASVLLLGLALQPAIARGADAEPPSTSIAVPGGEKGIGFDDLGFSPSLHKVLVPAGRAGKLATIDPQTKQLDTIGGFATAESFGGGHGEGITSVDEGKGVLFVTDRTAKRLDVVDPAKKTVVAFAELSAGPDYVRYVAETNEVWVTEPRAQGIEVFIRRRAEAGPFEVHRRSWRTRVAGRRSQAAPRVFESVEGQHGRDRSRRSQADRALAQRLQGFARARAR
jgi:hypothetical protein